MNRVTRYAILMLLMALAVAGTASATTYYIAANGSDSNNGTSKSTPWLHAPGMSNCTGTCASANPQPGDSFVLRGGDSWHFGNSGASPYIGTGWSWNWSGNSANCQLDASAGLVTKTSCIYLGVDQTWYSGSSWTRPRMNFDNPQSTSYQTCTYDESSLNALDIKVQYVVLDNFEWLGWCSGSSSGSGKVVSISNNNEVTNNYFHGWTLASSSALDQFRMIAPYTGSSVQIVDHNVFDGSDSSLGATPGQASGFALGAGSEIAYNVFWHISNGYIGGAAYSMHDNLFYYLMEPSDGDTHGNILEQQGEPTSGTYLYNNLSYDTNEGEGYNIYCPSTSACYIFNNISFGYRVTFPGGVLTRSTDGGNCFLLENTGYSGSRTFYYFNNTFDSQCSSNLKNITALETWQNNHFVGFTTSTSASLSVSLMGAINGTGATGINTDSGYEVYQSEAAANAQGYTPSNFYAPTSSSNATVGKGANLSSLCSQIGNSVVAAACTSGYGGVTYNQTTHTAVPNTVVPRGTTWDAGAYQFGGSSVNQPTPPSGVTATVQ